MTTEQLKKANELANRINELNKRIDLVTTKEKPTHVFYDHGQYVPIPTTTADKLHGMILADLQSQLNTLSAELASL